MSRYNDNEEKFRSTRSNTISEQLYTDMREDYGFPPAVCRSLAENFLDIMNLYYGSSNVVEEYRTACVGVGCTVWADTRNGNPDIFYDITGASPEISVKLISGGFGVSAEIKNVGTADTTNAKWSIDLEGGLVLIGKHADGTIPTLATGTSQKVKIGFVFGIDM